MSRRPKLLYGRAMREGNAGESLWRGRAPRLRRPSHRSTHALQRSNPPDHCRGADREIQISHRPFSRCPGRTPYAALRWAELRSARVDVCDDENCVATCCPSSPASAACTQHNISRRAADTSRRGHQLRRGDSGTAGELSGSSPGYSAHNSARARPSPGTFPYRNSTVRMTRGPPGSSIT